MSFVAVPGTRIGDYVVVSEIGRGGMAVVYLAEHPNLGRKVALKLLADKLSNDQSFRDRFMREARIAAGIEHPNIVPIHDAGEVEGLLFIAMRYVEGIDLARLLERDGSLSLARTQAIVSQVAAALDAAHSKGLVHRDVKPSNVLLASGEGPGGEDHAYLADFGLARPQIGSDLTQAGELYGTLDYMAPEQFDGRPLDARTDVYALACVTYECLTGVPPFHEASSLAKAASHLEKRPVPPSERNAELSKGINDVILRGLAKDKARRYDHAGEFAAALAGLLDGGFSHADSSTTPARTSTEPAASQPTTQLLGQERKVVSILACGFEAPEGVDPEDWRAAHARFSAAVIQETERFGGTLLGEIGGTVTCVFGAPLGHEDDAERAVRSALRIIDVAAALAEVMGVIRIGIATGEAFVDPHAQSERGEEFVTGGAVTTASRLLRLALPGQIVVDDRTTSLTRGTISYGALPATEIGGGSIAAWRVVEVKSRLGSGPSLRDGPDRSYGAG